jgi:hypothetical protein
MFFKSIQLVTLEDYSQQNIGLNNHVKDRPAIPLSYATLELHVLFDDSSLTSAFS